MNGDRLALDTPTQCGDMPHYSTMTIYRCVSFILFWTWFKKLYFEIFYSYFGTNISDIELTGKVKKKKKEKIETVKPCSLKNMKKNQFCIYFFFLPQKPSQKVNLTSICGGNGCKSNWSYMSRVDNIVYTMSSLRCACQMSFRTS